MTVAPGPDRGQAGRQMSATRACPGACRAFALARPPLARAGVRHRDACLAIARPAQPHAPAALADLELTKTGRAELGDEGGQKLAAQALDGGMVG
jgi:hypothetical protein